MTDESRVNFRVELHCRANRQSRLFLVLLKSLILGIGIVVHLCEWCFQGGGRVGLENVPPTTSYRVSTRAAALVDKAKDVALCFLFTMTYSQASGAKRKTGLYHSNGRTGEQRVCWNCIYYFPYRHVTKSPKKKRTWIPCSPFHSLD